MSDKAKAAQEFIDEDHSAEKTSSPSVISRFGGRRNIMIGAGVSLFVLGATGYAVAAYTGMLESEQEVQRAAGPAIYYDLPEMVVNLNAAEERAQYLKIKVALEVTDPNVLLSLEPVMPRVLDLFQLYLRELRSSDLEGSAGLFRLKEELLRRINLEVQPGKVSRVLFKEIIVQ